MAIKEETNQNPLDIFEFLWRGRIDDVPLLILPFTGSLKMVSSSPKTIRFENTCTSSWYCGNSPKANFSQQQKIFT